MRFIGTAFRAHNPRWSFRPTSGDGAAIHGGRFNAKGLPALYLALDPTTALKEASQGFPNKMEPCVICSYEVDCEDIVDLADEAGRRAEKVKESVLSAGWFAYLARGAEPPQWMLVRRLISNGAAGLLARSYASGATAADRNLVLWRWGPDMPHRIVVFDPSGRLPKDQLSWT